MIKINTNNSSRLAQSQGIRFKQLQPTQTSQPSVSLPPRTPKKLKLGFYLFLLIIVTLVVGGSTSIYKHYHRTPVDQNPRALIDAIGKLVELPKDEEPTVATVTDPTSLSHQSFFIEAKEGDKVLIFSKSKKAILYRPSEGRVIAVAPIVR